MGSKLLEVKSGSAVPPELQMQLETQECHIPWLGRVLQAKQTRSEHTG